ncbi:type II toxin-antitoxin system antitoxin SocA domain-containing protein [Vibrio alginolyticus]
MFDKNRLELLIQYALLRAGEEDDFSSRNLGPIHIIKYVYLADLYYAEKHGETFTNIDWQFHNFGPWSNNVYSSIDSSLTKIMARKECLESIYSDDDCVRWSLQDNDRLRLISREIPGSITVRLKRDIHTFTNDTKALLDFVYKTPPMLEGAPTKSLVFRVKPSRSQEEQPSKRIDALSKRKQKEFKSKLLALKASNQNRKPRMELVNPVVNPRRDEVYSNGIEWLETLSGEKENMAKEVVVEFSDDIWGSDTRKDYDFS